MNEANTTKQTPEIWAYTIKFPYEYKEKLLKLMNPVSDNANMKTTLMRLIDTAYEELK